ncbi:MAG TPA: hypothetical protein VEY12_12295 [Thermoplasmata archaeon]|nr:hypothetical protein [Thermoplasmata archaeon]
MLYAAQTSPVLGVPTTAQFGLLQVMPPLYWLGLGLLALSVALAARSKHDLLFVIAGAVLLGMFAATPGLFEPNPPVWDSYIHYAAAEDIIQVGRIPTDPSAYAANWPGFYLITAAAGLMGGLPPLDFLGIFPFFSGALTFLALFLFLRAFFPAGVVRPASVLSSALCVWAQYHVSPQGIGLSLALLVLATAWDTSVPLRIANAVLFIGLVVSHATSAIFVLAFFGLDALLALVAAPWAAKRAARPSPFALKFNPFLIYGAIWLSWLFFVAGGSAEITKSMIITEFGNILNAGESTANVIAARSIANIYIWSPRIRLGALAIFGLGAVVGLFLLFRKKDLRGPARFLLAAMAGLGILGVADIVLFKGLFYDRALMFFAILAPAALLWGLRMFELRPPARRAIFVVLLIAAVAGASTAYYQEPFYSVTAQSVAVSNFLSTHGSGLTVYDGEFPLPIWLLTRQSLPWEEIPFYTVYPDSVTGPAGPPGSTFAVFDQTAKLWYVQGHGIEIYQFYESQRSNYSLTYDNGYAQIYLLSRPPAT